MAPDDAYFARALREVHRKFAAIEVDRLRVKPTVKITGEFYLQTVEGDPNYNIHRWLEAEGAEVYPAAVTVWMDYLLRLGLQRFEDYSGIERGARLKLGAGRAAQAIYRWTFDRLRRALGDLPHEMPNQFELRRLAAPYFHSRLDGGEGDMLVGKAIWAHKKKKAHMICELSPYSCMPNTMSIGAMAGVVGKYPDLLYAPLEIKGDAEVHALSRCQMILTEAKKRAQREFDGALERTGLTVEEVRAYVEARPAMRRGDLSHPAPGLAAGTAANLVLHVAELWAAEAAWRPCPDRGATAPEAAVRWPREARGRRRRLHDRQGGPGRRGSRHLAGLPAAQHAPGREGARVPGAHGGRGGPDTRARTGSSSRARAPASSRPWSAASSCRRSSPSPPAWSASTRRCGSCPRSAART